MTSFLVKIRLKTYKIATSIQLTFEWDISRTIWRIEVSDASYFYIFHAHSLERNEVSLMLRQNGLQYQKTKLSDL